MSTTTIKSLNRLIGVAKSGEQGFLVAAENVRNRGLKVMLKSFAHQRGVFARELRDEVRRLGGEPRETDSFLASIHRGWINIKAAMTIGQQNTERVVLAEAWRGERTAKRAYTEAVAKVDDSAATDLVARQSQAVNEVATQIEHMAGQSGKRTVVRLFNEAEKVQRAVEALLQEGFAEASIRQVQLQEELNVYEAERPRKTEGESAAAGGVLGWLVGLVIGLAAGVGTQLVPEMNLGMEMGALPTMVITAAAGSGLGALFGSILGVLIGRGVVEEDRYLYADGLRYGSTLVIVEADLQRAEAAATIMFQAAMSRDLH